MKKLFALNTMSKKLLLILMSVALVSTATVTIVFSAYEITSAKEEQIESLGSLSKMLSPNITTALMFDDLDAVQELINPILIRSDVISIMVTSMTGEELVIAQSEDEDMEQSIEVSTPLQLDMHDYGILKIRANNSYIQDRITFYFKFIMILMVFTFAISLILSLLLRRRFLNPILYLAQTANKITTSHDYSLRAKQLSQDEVGQLTSCFNAMLYNIEQRENSLENQVRLRTNELENANIQLQQYAYQDGLTDLPNRRYFYEKLQSLVSIKGMKFALIFIDLDGFKEVNDSLGHDYGDLLLHQVATRLQSCITTKDTVARLGGDEFTLILEGVNSPDEASKIAEAVKSSLMQSIKVKKETVYVTASIGLTFFPADGLTVEELVRRADQAMYLSKNKGRNRYEFFSYAIEEKATEKRRLIEEIRTAIVKNQFELFYQPIFSIDGKSVPKAEALIRWNHPERGLIGPNEFIPVAEKNGLINNIGQWVKSQAIQDTVQFNVLSEKAIQVSVNTSPLEIDRAGCWVDEWIVASKKYQLPANTILIEVTENTLMDPDSSIQRQLKRLSTINIDIAIDDFGVGYSSLAYLQRLDIDILKIDRSFINDIESNDNSIALVKAIITMAHNLDVMVVAEGVETQKQYDLLKQLACDYIQGYIFSKAITKQEFMEKYIIPIRNNT
ncbi:EAL domain-containing protein [Pseudoalteromonas sp. SR43-6]|uniref:putative bifunctional diguanylate cyclase/phosphodiesterase n=1 Tax=unclassified Pseudoalteromonas TaxID=194690 RepID=UPI0015F7B28B|nr:MULTISPECIES: EAL domain-containing protein [unclassified Pseudoalteromonas]MBB1288052.1 EAL domain-containing protein [Pseudoalteromonas sp. SR41-5]MBB1374191.1 EAL domain-containing protein [Pseudoalteromonas sp. SR43-6]MBB1413612.1 EAL domain-containing protein [Pseudoalteromonas sp. SG43-8]